MSPRARPSYELAVFAVGRRDSVEGSDVKSQFRHQGRQPSDEIQWLEGDVRRAVSVRHLQLVTDVAIRRERQALLGSCRPTNVSAKPFELLALISSRGHAGVQGKSSDLTDPVIERLLTRRHRLQPEHLAAPLRPYGNTVRNRRTVELIHWPGLEVIPSQVAVLHIALRQPLAFEVVANAQCQFWISQSISAPVGAFTQRYRSALSGRSTYNPSKNSMWKWTSWAPDGDTITYAAHDPPGLCVPTTFNHLCLYSAVRADP